MQHLDTSSGPTRTRLRRKNNPKYGPGSLKKKNQTEESIDNTGPAKREFAKNADEIPVKKKRAASPQKTSLEADKEPGTSSVVLGKRVFFCLILFVFRCW